MYCTLVPFILTQDKGKLVDNYRWFCFADLVKIILGSAIGVVVGVTRIAFTVLLTVLMFPRLDRSIFNRTFEQFDSGN